VRSPTESGTGLRGRVGERERLDGLIAAARAGSSGALVVRGEAGIGKSALLDHALTHASGCRVVRAAGVESEMELAYAGVHQLCAPLLDRLDHIPGPQGDALGTAFGLHAGPPPDRFLVALAILSLLSDAAEQQPLIGVVDDAQWLDHASAQALGFVARRLAQEAVVLLFAVRDPADGLDLTGLPELVLGPLDDTDARAVVAAAIPGRLDEPVRDRIVAEARGNPLALLELPRSWTPGAFSGGFGLPSGGPTASRVGETFRQRLATLPGPSRQLLLLVAAAPGAEPAMIWAAAGRLGVTPDAMEPAIEAGLFDPGPLLRFRSPLVRGVVYGEATPAERRLAHAALADAADPETDRDRRAWHRAHATERPDESIAVELEASAERAQRRGGVAAAAAFLGLATELTEEPALRAERALATAQARYLAGGPDVAQRWLAQVDAGPRDPLRDARADLLRGQIAFSVNRGTRGGPAPRQGGEGARAARPGARRGHVSRCVRRGPVRWCAGWRAAGRGRCGRWHRAGAG
jgi:hypothetical protein